MKNIKKLLTVLLALSAVLCMALCITACQQPEDSVCTSHVDGNGDGLCDNEGCGETLPLSPTADYTVNLTMYGGAPFEDLVFLYVYKNGETVAQKRMTEPTYTVNLPRDNYTFVIDSYDAYAYDESEAVFTPTKTAADIVMYNSLGNAQQISIACTKHVDSESDGECDKCGKDIDLQDGAEYYVKAPNVSVGASLVTIYPNERTYFVFTPTESGVYKFTCVADGEFTFGNYGMPQVVLPGNISEVADGSFTATVQDTAIGSDGGGTLQMVLGVNSSASTAVIVVERVSDPPAEMPFTEIHASDRATKYTDLLNNEFIDINVTKNVTVVYNENDGYYHYGTAEGPLVFAKITVGGNSYLSDSFEFPSFEAICSTGNMCCYFYEDGVLVKRESYNTLIAEYAELAGARGLVPLDKTLADAIKNAGNHNGWWGDNSIFGSDAVNKENAWLFACAYINELAIGYDFAPIELSPIADADFAVSLDGENGCYMNVAVEDDSTTELSFKNADGVTVVVGGNEYTADSDGNIEISLSAAAAVEIRADEAMELHFTCVAVKNNPAPSIK